MVVNGRILLIGGQPRTGKSELAKKLCSQFGCKGLETDHMRVLFNGDPQSPISYVSGAKISKAKKAAVPYLSALILGLDEVGANFVIEGELVTPQLVTASPIRDRLVAVFFGQSDIEVALANIRRFSQPPDWTTRFSDDELRPILEDFVRRSRKLEARCAEFGYPYYSVTDGFEAAQAAALQVMTVTGAKVAA